MDAPSTDSAPSTSGDDAVNHAYAVKRQKSNESSPLTSLESEGEKSQPTSRREQIRYILLSMCDIIIFYFFFKSRLLGACKHKNPWHARLRRMNATKTVL